ncbi:MULTISPECIES: hypothetical protein [Vibrio]|uniref:Uncharacterized protein n=1 Tax=Vibrio bivalvicida TaxID=1276888 RepID=A0A177Y476_9VIBR|nr:MULTISPECIES: hypothetical protein [Vibrio]KLN64008.1 hypothetical protein ZX61_17745 [Vibrio sp. VPAP30]OAJ95275.1 hypothetical protein APB76_05630 [Vibrio bivalvicida]
MAGVLTYCKIQEMEVSPTMARYLQEIESKVELGNLLAISLSGIPILELFTKRVAPHTRIQEIGEYDWEQFGTAMSSVHSNTRRLVNNIADDARLFSKNQQEVKFWGCVYDATR